MPRPTRSSLTTVPEMIAEGLVDAGQGPALERVAADFRLRISPEMRAALTPGDAADPVAAQFVPDVRELDIRADELADPIGDDAHSPVPGLTHRYPDRAILHLTHDCAVYCRFCFRREVVGGDGALPEAQLSAVLDYIAATPALREIILTGGDPMVLSPRRLGAVIGRLAGIPHLETLRIHTRVPVVAPERIDPSMLAALKGRLPVWVVVHTNHAAELTPPARAALARLADAGVPMLSQTVLLRGVNARTEALAELFRALLACRVKPYYLHHPDLAKGTGHFRLSLAEGREIVRGLRGHLSGAAVPTYVLDLPGGHGKVPVLSDDVVADGEGWRIRDWRGVWHRYEG